MKLIPVYNNRNQNKRLHDHPGCSEILEMVYGLYERVTYVEPWIGYFAEINNEIVGSCGYKYPPRDGQIEIAYGTFEKHRKQGIASEICKHLVQLALKTDPKIRITARTLPTNDASNKVLQNNGFFQLGTVWDEEDGDVWEWEYRH